MKIISQPAEVRQAHRPVCAAIGVFDGVHLGHRAVINWAVAEARRQGALSVAITFDRHPRSVVEPERAPLLIQSLPDKLAEMEKLGLDAALVYRFDLEFSRQPPEEFIRQLADGFGRLRALSVGANFGFGHQRRGNAQSLQQSGARMGFAVEVASPVSFQHQPVSSSRIRRCIAAGALPEVDAMLGRPYAFSGPVRRGDGLGRQLGFPTANLDVEGLALPPQGVYAVRARVAGQLRPAVLNIGLRPTLNRPHPERRVEVHLLDWSGDLYGVRLEVVPGPRLREEIKFSSLAALQNQIAEDISRARVLLEA